MLKKRVYALARDSYWLQATKEAADESIEVEPIPCHTGYPECLETMPSADPESLLLVDATGHADVVGIVQGLLARGWRYIVVVAADPSWKEAHAVLKIAQGYDYWQKSYVPNCIRQKIRVWQEEVAASSPADGH